VPASSVSLSRSVSVGSVRRRVWNQCQKPGYLERMGAESSNSAAIVKAARKAAGLFQAAFAVRTGTSKGQVSQGETGKAVPSESRITAIREQFQTAELPLSGTGDGDAGVRGAAKRLEALT
jgi:ribosome-binding protein aMBF1 (putative translation factor)